MAKLNQPVRKDPIYTHEGAKTKYINQEQELRRSVMACMLWEDTFYEDGESIADRIIQTVPKVSAVKVAQMAIEAREQMKLRHVPLFLAREMAKLNTHKGFVADTLERIIQRPDELTEFLAIYWKEKRQPLSAQVKKGLARAFIKFNEYSLAKYNRDNAIKLRDVFFLTHPKAKDDQQYDLFNRLVNDQLVIPDTWEVALSGGNNKKETWERLIKEDKLGGLAFLRNLRNMSTVGVEEKIVFEGLNKMKTERILPFRFIAAAKYVPQWEAQIEPVMLKCLEGKAKLPGKTALVVDGSGSMFGIPISKKSEIDRFEAAAALAIMAREICENCVAVVFSIDAFLVPSRRGFALRDVLYSAAQHGGTNTQNGIMRAAKEGYDRIIVITDEQSHQAISNPLIGTKSYIINIANYQNGIGYGEWVHIDGWSEAVLDYIIEYEKGEEQCK